MVVKCENYREGMCFYLSKDLEIAIFEKCYCAKISNEYQEKEVSNCKKRGAIKILERWNLEKKLSNDNL